MGVVVNACDSFARNTNTVQSDRVVDIVINDCHDHMFLRLHGVRSTDDKEWIAVPYDKYPDIVIKAGDRVRLQLSSKLIAPYASQKPCPVVFKISKLTGELKIGRFVYHSPEKGHRYAR